MCYDCNNSYIGDIKDRRCCSGLPLYGPWNILSEWLRNRQMREQMQSAKDDVLQELSP